MAPNTDPHWRPGAPTPGTQGDHTRDPHDDRPAWLTEQSTTTLSEPSFPGGSTEERPRDGGGSGPPEWAVGQGSGQQSFGGGQGFGSGQWSGQGWSHGPRLGEQASPWGTDTTGQTTPLGSPPWDSRTGGTDQHGGAPKSGRLRRGLTFGLVVAVLVAAVYGASGLVQDDAAPQGAGVPPTQAGPGPVKSSGVEPVAAVAEALIPSVVRLQTDTGLGSGVIYDANGYILTAAHVIADASTVTVRMSDGNSLQGKVLGADDATDVGVVKVDGQGFPAATLATSVELQVGQMAVAIGSPFGLQDTVTSGIISGLNRTIPIGNGEMRNVLQTDAPINSGNSGGPLADRQGRVIGINSAIRSGGDPTTGGGGNIGIGFAIPIDTAARVATSIVKGKPLKTTYVGVRGNDSPTAAGALVQEVVPGSPAAAAGLKPGDLITGFDGEPIGGMNDLIAKTHQSTPGDTVTLRVVRNGKEESIEVTLGAKTD